MKIFTELSAVQGGSYTYEGYSEEEISDMRSRSITAVMENFPNHNLASATYIVDLVFTGHSPLLRKCRTYYNGDLEIDSCNENIYTIGGDIRKIAADSKEILTFCSGIGARCENM